METTTLIGEQIARRKNYIASAKKELVEAYRNYDASTNGKQRHIWRTRVNVLRKHIDYLSNPENFSA